MMAAWKPMQLPVVRQATLATLLLVFFACVAQTVSAQSNDDRNSVLAVNTEFYRAFRESDLPGMDQVWGGRGAISVEHPSGWRLEGREAVMQSWAILMHRPPRITCIVEGVSFTNGQATVYCNEQLNPGSVRMKNVFHREEGGWKMIYHGPVPKDELMS